MIGVELVIDTRIVLVTVDVGSVSIREVKTLDAACEPNERGIQTIRGRFPLPMALPKA